MNTKHECTCANGKHGAHGNIHSGGCRNEAVCVMKASPSLLAWTRENGSESELAVLEHGLFYMCRLCADAGLNAGVFEYGPDQSLDGIKIDLH